LPKALHGDERLGVAGAGAGRRTADPYGIKPLYYGRFQGGIVLASQVKAILATSLVSTAPSPEGQVGFWLLGSVPEPHTWYRDISAIPSGSYAWIENSEIKSVETWFDIRAVWRDAPPNQLDSQSVLKAVHECLRESVQRHLVSDVPVGVFLSGGIDSGALAGLMADVGAHDLQGVTIAYSEYAGTNDDESPASAAIAKHYGIEHHVRQVSKQEFLEDLPQIIDSMDQPSIDGINTWYAAKAVKELGLKVVVSGVGGDELFLGYESFNTLPRIVSLWNRTNWVPGSKLLAGQVANLQAAFSKNNRWRFAPKLLTDMRGAWLLLRSLMSPLDAAAKSQASIDSQVVSQDLISTYGRANPGDLPDDLKLALAQTESTMYLRNQLLRDSDWASMHHSVELRTPLVDAWLLQSLKPFLTAFPHFPKKTLLATSPSKPLPDIIRKRPKTGFFIPVYQWMQEVTCNSQDLKPIAWAKFVASKFN